jgi:putative alpha-1,2-mannosidase
MPRSHTAGLGPVQQPTVGNRTEVSGPLNDRIGGLFTWSNSSPRQIKSRVGISFISTSKACAFKDSEIPSWNLNATVSAAKEEWNRDVFSKIKVATGPSENQTNLVLLYSSLYFMHLMPSERTGENPLWESNEPYWDDFYTLWDIFRNTVSLYHLIQPEYYKGMIRSLIDIWRHEGFMPDGRSGNYNGLVQGGSNSDNVLADAYIKGLREGINWTDGYAAMVKNAEVQPANTFSYDDPTGSVKEGRGALYDWLALGYVSSDKSTRGISRTVEYALNDFSLSQVAKDIAPGDVQKYLVRSAGWQKIWAHNVSSVNTSEPFTGFLAPRLANGSWNTTGYNPALCGGCEWQAISYEATPFGIVIQHIGIGFR